MKQRPRWTGNGRPARRLRVRFGALHRCALTGSLPATVGSVKQRTRDVSAGQLLRLARSAVTDARRRADGARRC